MKTTTLQLNRLSCQLALLLIPLAFALFVLAPPISAMCDQLCDLNRNTAFGLGALRNNIGFDNTAIGIDALFANTNGSENTATGQQALLFNTTGVENTANGAAVLIVNTTGFDNTGNGAFALLSNTTGNNNTATGAFALKKNTTGRRNTADGGGALQRNTTGSDNIALGSNAGINLTTGNNNIDIGNGGVNGEAGTIRIGTTGAQTNAYITGISGATVPTGVAVIVDTTGHLGTTTSSARYKEAIKPMDKTSEAILALKPVTFRYKHDLDPNGIPQFGLVAEEVEKVNPDLVARDEQGKPYTVRYEAVNAMLLNEFLKEHQKVQRLEAALAAVNERLKVQDAKIDKVNAQLELSRPWPRAVVTSQ